MFVPKWSWKCLTCHTLVMASIVWLPADRATSVGCGRDMLKLKLLIPSPICSHCAYTLPCSSRGWYNQFMCKKVKVKKTAVLIWSKQCRPNSKWSDHVLYNTGHTQPRISWLKVNCCTNSIEEILKRKKTVAQLKEKPDSSCIRSYIYVPML